MWVKITFVNTNLKHRTATSRLPPTEVTPQRLAQTTPACFFFFPKVHIVPCLVHVAASLVAQAPERPPCLSNPGNICFRPRVWQRPVRPRLWQDIEFSVTQDLTSPDYVPLQKDMKLQYCNRSKYPVGISVLGSHSCRKMGLLQHYQFGYINIRCAAEGFRLRMEAASRAR